MLRSKTLSIVTLCSMVLASCGNNKQADESVAAKPSEATPVATETVVRDRNILFFGTSLTAGYGLEQGEAYPALLQQRIDSLNLPYKTINGGLSGETSAAGKNRIDWLLKQPVSIFVLELGANDGLRGIAVKETTANLQTIIDKVKKKYPRVQMVLMGMEVPPNMGDKYATDFRNMFKNLAAKNEMVFVPFLLEGVAGISALNQSDGIHPTAEGQHILANNVWLKLKDLL